MANALETADKQAVKRDALLPIIFSKLGPGKPLITVGELKQAVSKVPDVRFDVKGWIEDLVRQLYVFMYLDRKEPTEEEREIYGGKIRHVYWSIRELPIKRASFVNSCIEPARAEDLPTRGVISGPDDEVKKEVKAQPAQEVLPPEAAAQIAVAVLGTLPEMIKGMQAIESKLRSLEAKLEEFESKLLAINALQILQEERAKHKIEAIRKGHMERQDMANG